MSNRTAAQSRRHCRLHTIYRAAPRLITIQTENTLALGTTGKMRFSIEFSEAERGKIGYIRSAWETRAGPVRFNII